MRMKSLCAMMLAAICGAGLTAVADSGGAPGPWRPLLEDNSAPAWRGWKESGFPAGWHVARGVLSRTARSMIW